MSVGDVRSAGRNGESEGKKEREEEGRR